MDGKQASLLATDPPYLVDYTGGNHPDTPTNRKETKDKGWDEYVDPDASVEFFRSFLTLAGRSQVRGPHKRFFLDS